MISGPFVFLIVDLKRRMSNSKQTVLEVSNQDFQKANLFNKYLPFYPSIKQQSSESFEEICENLSRIIQAQELQPGFPLWTSKLQQFISLYGFHFTKSNHLKLIDFYLSVLAIKSLNLTNAKTCLDMLAQLTRCV